MTIDQFANEFSRLVGRGWFVHVVMNGRIRLAVTKEIPAGELFCPLTAVAEAKGCFFGVDDWEVAGEYLGLSQVDSEIIQYMADHVQPDWLGIVFGSCPLTAVAKAKGRFRSFSVDNWEAARGVHVQPPKRLTAIFGSLRAASQTG